MARELPIHNGRLTTDLDADGHRIKNLPGGGTSTVAWENVTGKPEFATVATSGSYNDLRDVPLVPIPPMPSSSLPIVDGTAAYGSSLEYARGDHVHPTDTTREAVSRKVVEIRAQNTHTEYPSAKAVYDALQRKANSSGLRYRIAEAGLKWQFAASAFPITYMDTIASTAVTITAGYAGDITWDVQSDGGAYVLYNGFDFAYFRNTGDYGGSKPGVDLQFNGVAAANASEPLVQILADRAVNLITATDETSIDIELPGPVEEPTGVRRARDFILDVDNSANASDLALEFTELGVEYLFVTDADDSIGDMMTVSGYGTGESGDGERVRLYFTECAFEGIAPRPGPIFHVARVTLSADSDEIPTTTQGGNS